ncbi:MAG: NifU-like protein involved in Fe-S cluster formation [Alphaproteobacteria bacterium]|jgi:NifU-like protein involved in Fe-S cluster formation
MLDDIYSNKIVELAADIPLIGKLQNADSSATAVSRLCGSKVTVFIKVEGNKVIDFSHDVKACALGQASSSVMARNVIGSSFDELKELANVMRKMLKENGPPPSGKWSELSILEPVKDFKSRHASTLLTFDAVNDAIEKIK